MVGRQERGAIRFGVRIPPCAAVDVLAKEIARAETSGFDVAWIADSQLLWRDVFATMAVAALHTDSISLATAVTNFATRHPSVVASAVNTVAELAPGRVVLGVGSGDSSVKLLDREPSTRAHMRESIAMARALLDGQFLDFGRRRSHLKDARGRVPVHIAASGPRTFALAGEIADGIVTLAGIAPDTVRQTREAVQAGCQRADRALAELEFTVGAFCKVTDDIERDAAILKPLCLHMASIGGQQQLALAGIELDPPESVPSVYPDMVHAEDWDVAVEHASRYVTDEMAVRFAHTFCLFGTVEDIVARIHTAIEMGATGFYLRHVGNYSLPSELIDTFGAEVLPRFQVGQA